MTSTVSVLIAISIVGGIIGHILVTVVFEIVFMLTEIKQQQRRAEKIAALDANTAATPDTVTIEPCNISDNWGDINTAVQFAGKYVILDLSACTATDNTIKRNQKPTDNDLNIIKDNEYVKGIILPESLTTIGDYVFYGCKNLTHVTIPSSVTSIGVSAFSGCTSLTSVTFSQGSNIDNSSFGSSAFPEGSSGNRQDTLKEAYGIGKAGTYTRAVDGSIWTKQE